LYYQLHVLRHPVLSMLWLLLVLLPVAAEQESQVPG
jgi:hypothetical protein